MFELRVIDPLPGLEDLGAEVQLRELPMGEYSAVFDAAHATGRGIVYIIANSLFVDGRPLGIDGFDALPGRYHAASRRLFERVAWLYNIKVIPAGGEASPGADDAGKQQDEPAQGEA